MAKYKEKKGSTPSDKIAEIRDSLKACVDFEDSERDMMMDDLRFCTLDQWPEEIRKEREGDMENGPRPCLTIDKINQYIVQVVNDMRQGKPGINVRPQDDKSDPETAKIIKGLIRNIEDQSNADIAYAVGGESAAKIGLGYWRVVAEYIAEDSFDQDLFIRPIPNTFSTYLGHHVMPDGSDAKEGFIIENMPVARFKELYPDAKSDAGDFDVLQSQMSFWITDETITVVEYYCLEEKVDTLYYLADGTTITKSDYDAWPESQGAKPNFTDERVTRSKQLKWKKMTGLEILDERDLPGKFIPIIEVVGREQQFDGKRCLWGLVRPAKDSLRMYNYWSSTITEKMALAPKTPYIGAVGQFENFEDQWKQANRKNFAFLQYNAIDVNGNAIPAPQRQPATPMEAALLQQMQVIEHDVQTSLGMFKAAVGETESQQSGRAILALQRESDTGTYHFGANLGVSIRHTGRVLLDLIPHYYDTARVIRIIGEDGSVQSANIDPEQEMPRQQIRTDDGTVKNIYNPMVGKYDVSISVGPSYNTKRMEAATILTEVVKSQPQLMPVIGDILFMSLDIPYGDKIAERMRKALPPALQDDEGEPIPAKAQQQIQQLIQMGEQMKEALQKAQQENQQLKAGAQVAQQKVEADAQATMAKLQAEREATMERIRLQREEIQAKIELAARESAAMLEIKRAESAEGAGAEIESAIAKITSLAERHMMRVQTVYEKGAKEGEGGETTVNPENARQAQEMSQQFMSSVTGLVEALRQKQGNLSVSAAQQNIMPPVVDMMREMMQMFMQVMEEQRAQTAQVMQAAAQPKTVQIQGIRRDANGQLAGVAMSVMPAQQTIQ